MATLNHFAWTMVGTLRSPVVITAQAPTLDAMLYEALRMRYCNWTRQQVLEEMRKYLGYREDLGVFQASSARLCVNDFVGVVPMEYARVDRRTTAKMSSAMYRPGRKLKVPATGGPTKLRAPKYPAYAAPLIAWDFFGDAYAIEALLTEYGIGAGYDAQNSGMGAIRSWEMIKLEKDRSLVLDGQPNRPLPLDAQKALGIEAEADQQMVAIVPPYYPSFAKPGLAPARLRVCHYNSL